MASVTWESCLRQCVDKPLQNASAGTPFADYAEKHGFGLFVVRGAFESKESFAAHEEVRNMFKGLVRDEQRGVRAIAVQGATSVRHYNSAQFVSGHCTCMSKYQGTGRHQVYKLEEFPAVAKPAKWLQGLACKSGVVPFNQVVVNEYSRKDNERIAYHSDANSLLADSTEILSLSLGAPGVFCYEPDTSLGNTSPFFSHGWYAVGALKKVKRLVSLYATVSCQSILLDSLCFVGFPLCVL